MDAVRRPLLELQKKEVVRIDVYALRDNHSREDLALWDPLKPRLFPARFPRSFGYSPELRKALQSGEFNLIHSHGLWMHPAIAAGKIARAGRIPHIVHAHGMLDPASLQRKRWKKLPIWTLWEKSRIEQARVIVATSDLEADNLRALGLKNPIAIVPCGVDVPRMPADHSGKEPRSLVFISRIHPQKGLPNLIQAWSILKPKGWRVVIAGPSQFDHVEELKKAVASIGAREQFTFPGPVYGDAKLETLRGANLFALPSHSECFGIAIAESLAAGVPVITTKGAPWRELAENSCGWWVDIGVEPLAAALREAMALSDAERREMGLRGRQLVQEKYSWPQIAQEMLSVYEWVLGKGEKPDCVRTL